MTTLAILTSQLEAICEQIEDSEELPCDLLGCFAEASLEHAKKVGIYVSTINTLKNNAKYYKERVERLTHRIKVYEAIEADMKNLLMVQMQEHPDLPWKSNEGDKIKIQNNAEKLAVNIPLDKRHINNVISENAPIPTEYVVVNTFYTLNTDAVRADLKAGKVLDWAKFERGQHLRIY